MTVIRPNSVSGINSITAQADEIKVFKSNGTQGGLIIGGANLNATTGISTILALNVTGNVSIAGTLTYQDVTNVDSIGIITARAGVNVSGGQIDVGSNIKIGNAGVITATSFSGSGANLTNLDASDLASGTVPTARLGSGTASSSTFLRGDSTFATVTSVGGATGVDFNDNVKARFGTGNDLEIYHNASHSIIHDNGTGDLKIIGDDVIIQANNDDTMAKFIEDGAVELYHDNSKKAETFGSGFKVSSGGELYIDGNAAGGHCQLVMTRSDMSYMIANETFLRFYRAGGNSSSPNTLTAEFTNSGHFRPGANNTYDLGDSSTRWRNIYTNDLNLSNEGSTNSVDNTWGNYTIQEGESDLYLINNRNGKKYKFNLTEVS